MAGTAAQSAAAEDRSSASIGSEICTGRLPSLNSMHGRRPLSRCVSSHEQQWPGGSSKGSGLCTTLHAQCAEAARPHQGRSTGFKLPEAATH